MKKKHSSSYADERRAEMWFRPEKFKILLSFLQIFSQMKNNYGIPWSPLTAEYMRFFSGLNVDVVKIVAVDCLYRSNFYFGVVIACAFPLVASLFIFVIYRFGRRAVIIGMRKFPRKCVRTGDIVIEPMSHEHYMELQKKAAKTSLENDDIDDEEQLKHPEAMQKAIKEAMGHNVSGLPPGSSVSQSYWNSAGILNKENLEQVVTYNIRTWRRRIIERMEFIRFKSKLWKLFFWTLLLCYPSISIRILRVFACEQIGDFLVLSEDLTLRCFSKRWIIYATLAASAGALFIVGIPALFLGVLVSARNRGVEKTWAHCIRFPDHKKSLLQEAKEDADVLGQFWTLDKDADGDYTIKEEKEAVCLYLRRKNMRNHRNYERLGFIYYSYKEECWWYEIVELSRKLVLNGCMVLIAEGLVTRVVAGVLVCFFYLVLMNHFRPYTCMSDFTLQNICHIQLFLTVFAGLMIKGKVPYLGFENYWRPIEQKVVEVVVIASHALTLIFGLASILWEKFFSSEVRRLRALQKKNANERKQRMVKFTRARKNLMAGLRSQMALKKGGINAFGSKKIGTTPDNTGKANTVGGLAGMNFAWPDQGGKQKEDSSSSESEVDLDHWSSSESPSENSDVERESSQSASSANENTSATDTMSDNASGSSSSSSSHSSSNDEESEGERKEKVTADFNWD